MIRWGRHTGAWSFVWVCSVFSTLASAKSAVSPTAASPPAAPPTAASPSAATTEPGAAEKPAPDPKLRTAKASFAEGVKAFRDQRYQDAIDEFLIADSMAPSAALSYNIARAYDRLAQPAGSAFWYGDYLRRDPAAKDHTEVLEIIRKKEQELAREQKQLLVVLSEPTGARVVVDGAKAGTTPWYAPLPAGNHDVQLELAGFEAATATAALSLSEALVITVQLQERAVAAPVPPEPTPLPVKSAPSGGEPVAAPQDRRPVVVDENTLPWPWLTLGLGGVSLGAALGFELARQGAEDDATAATIQLDALAAQDRMEDHQARARIFLGAGVLLAATGGVLLYLDSRSSAENRVSGRCGPWGCNIELLHRY